MEATKSMAYKGNPLRRDISWWMVFGLGLVALAVGIYILAATESARKNIVFAIGLFLLFNGVTYALAGIRADTSAARASGFMLIRSGIGIATGVIIVINRFSEFMGINPARVVVGIGLVGMGAASLIGLVLSHGEIEFRLGSVVGPLVLAIWGIATLYQAANDASSSRLLGWLAIVAGLAYCAIAIYRRQAETGSAVATA